MNTEELNELKTEIYRLSKLHSNLFIKAVSNENFPWIHKESENKILNSFGDFIGEKYNKIINAKNQFYVSKKDNTQNKSIEIVKDNKTKNLLKNLNIDEKVKLFLSEDRVKKAYVQDNNLNFIKCIQTNSSFYLEAVDLKTFKKICNEIFLLRFTDDIVENLIEFSKKQGIDLEKESSDMIKKMKHFLSTDCRLGSLDRNVAATRLRFKIAWIQTYLNDKKEEKNLKLIIQLLPFLELASRLYTQLGPTMPIISKTKTAKLVREINLKEKGERDLSKKIKEICSEILNLNVIKKEKIALKDSYTRVYSRSDYYLKELSEKSSIIKVEHKNPVSGHVSIKSKRIPKNENISQEEVEFLVKKLTDYNKIAEEASIKEIAIKVAINNNNKKTISLVSGDSITSLYNLTSYDGVLCLYDSINYTTKTLKENYLTKSCMRYSNCKEKIEFYAKNPEYIKMIALTDNSGKTLYARAIVWVEKETGNMYVDRIYYSDNESLSLVRNYVENSENMFFIFSNERHMKKFRKKDIIYMPNLDLNVKSLPYMDSAHFVNTAHGIAVRFIRKYLELNPMQIAQKITEEILSGEPTFEVPVESGPSFYKRNNLLIEELANGNVCYLDGVKCDEPVRVDLGNGKVIVLDKSKVLNDKDGNKYIEYNRKGIRLLISITKDISKEKNIAISTINDVGSVIFSEEIGFEYDNNENGNFNFILSLRSKFKCFPITSEYYYCCLGDGSEGPSIKTISNSFGAENINPDIFYDKNIFESKDGMLILKNEYINSENISIVRSALLINFIKKTKSSLSPDGLEKIKKSIKEKLIEMVNNGAVFNIWQMKFKGWVVDDIKINSLSVDNLHVIGTVLGDSNKEDERRIPAKYVYLPRVREGAVYPCLNITVHAECKMSNNLNQTINENVSPHVSIEIKPEYLDNIDLYVEEIKKLYN